MDERYREDALVEEEISLREILEVLKKRAKVIALIAIISALASALITFFVIKPSYQSVTTIMVGKPKSRIVDPNNPITYQELQTNRLLVSTYREIARSRTVLEQVIKNLKLDMDYESLVAKVDVNLVKDTEIIQVEVTDHNPENAALIANEIARCFSEQVIKIMNVENVQVIDRAIPVYKPVKPRPALNISIALILGLMIGVFAAFVLEFFDTSIKSPEDVAKYLGLPVIGTIPVMEESEV